MNGLGLPPISHHWTISVQENTLIALCAVMITNDDFSLMYKSMTLVPNFNFSQVAVLAVGAILVLVTIIAVVGFFVWSTVVLVDSYAAAFGECSAQYPVWMFCLLVSALLVVQVCVCLRVCVRESVSVGVGGCFWVGGGNGWPPPEKQCPYCC